VVIGGASSGLLGNVLRRASTFPSRSRSRTGPVARWADGCSSGYPTMTLGASGWLRSIAACVTAPVVINACLAFPAIQMGKHAHHSQLFRETAHWPSIE